MLKETRVRLARMGDVDAVLDGWWLLVEEQNAHDDRARRTDGNLERARRFVTTHIQQGRLWVAQWREHIVGLLTVAPDDFFLESGPQVWVIADVWVHPHMRRRGLAHRLMAAAEAMAWEQGADEVRLTVHEENTGALDLYSALGYTNLVRGLRKRRPV